MSSTDHKEAHSGITCTAAADANSLSRNHRFRFLAVSLNATVLIVRSTNDGEQKERALLIPKYIIMPIGILRITLSRELDYLKAILPPTGDVIHVLFFVHRTADVSFTVTIRHHHGILRGDPSDIRVRIALLIKKQRSKRDHITQGGPTIIMSSLKPMPVHPAALAFTTKRIASASSRYFHEAT